MRLLSPAVLESEPRCATTRVQQVDEATLKKAFQVLKTGGIAMGKGVKRDEKKQDENKPISIEELKLLRDSQRQLYDTFVPGLEVGWDGEAQGKMQPLDKHGEPQTRRIDCESQTAAHPAVTRVN